MQSVPPNTNQPIEAKTAREIMIDWLAATLDPDFPSATVVASSGGVDDAGEYGNEARQKPDFVRADDENFNCG